jgi:hypothetical protein
MIASDGYPKINTVFRRDDKGNILPEQITKREFEAINNWTITEKIDGMNIRVDFFKTNEGEWELTYGGRTDRAQIPANLLNHLDSKFRLQLKELTEYFEKNDASVRHVVFYGEGYGAGIQKGGDYSKEQRFIAFDMFIDGWWLEQLHAKRICEEVGVPFVPVLLFTTKKEAVEFVKSKPVSRIFDIVENVHPMEGVVATSNPLMLFRDGTPIKWKLKQKDYKV